MFALVNEETVVEYPILDVRAKFPNISFPVQMENHHLPPGMVRIEPTEMPTVGRTQYVVEGTPVKNGSTWLQTWEIHNKDAEHIQHDNRAKAQSVRNERLMRLTDTDWVVTRAAESGQPVPPAYVAYRQALRDVTSQPGFPWDVKWPDAP